MATPTQPLSQSPAPMDRGDQPKLTTSSYESPAKAPSSDVHKDTPSVSTHKDTPPPVAQDASGSDSQSAVRPKLPPSSGSQKDISSDARKIDPRKAAMSFQGDKPTHSSGPDTSKDAALLDPRKAALTSQGDKPVHAPDVPKDTTPDVPKDTRTSESQKAAPGPDTHKEGTSSDAHKDSSPPDTHKEATSSNAQKDAPPSDTQKRDPTKEPVPEEESEGTPKRDPNMPKLRPEQMARPTEVPPQPHPERMQKEREEKKAEAEKGEGGEGQNEHEEYPEQKHAGQVGYGPNYVNINGPPSFIDKLKGFKEEVKGKILRKPELVQQGHDRISGELKKKEKEKMDHEGPFAQKGDAQKKDEKDEKNEAERKDDKDEDGQKSKPSGRGGARIETHGESKPAHPDHRDHSYAHTSIAERHKSVSAERTKAE